MRARVEPLTRSACLEHLAELLAAHAGASPWNEENLLRELPDKWRLSLYALAGNRAVAYGILSHAFDGNMHLHQLMTHADHRGQGIGGDLLQAARRQLTPGRRFSTKVHKDNVRAMQLYARHGFRFERTDGESIWMIA